MDLEVNHHAVDLEILLLDEANCPSSDEEWLSLDANQRGETFH